MLLYARLIDPNVNDSICDNTGHHKNKISTPKLNP